MYGFRCMDSDGNLIRCIDSHVSIQMHWFICIDSDVSIQMHWFRCIDSHVSIQMHWFRCIDSDASIEMYWFRCIDSHVLAPPLRRRSWCNLQFGVGARQRKIVAYLVPRRQRHFKHFFLLHILNPQQRTYVIQNVAHATVLMSSRDDCDKPHWLKSFESLRAPQCLLGRVCFACIEPASCDSSRDDVVHIGWSAARAATHTSDHVDWYHWKHCARLGAAPYLYGRRRIVMGVCCGT